MSATKILPRRGRHVGRQAFGAPNKKNNSRLGKCLTHPHCLRFTSKHPLKVQISKGLGACSRLNLCKNGRADLFPESSLLLAREISYSELRIYRLPGQPFALTWLQSMSAYSVGHNVTVGYSTSR